MRDHDLVSDGFLALTAAGFVLLCSSLLVRVQLIWRRAIEDPSAQPLEAESASAH